MAEKAEGQEHLRKSLSEIPGVSHVFFATAPIEVNERQADTQVDCIVYNLTSSVERIAALDDLVHNEKCRALPIILLVDDIDKLFCVIQEFDYCFYAVVDKSNAELLDGYINDIGLEMAIHGYKKEKIDCSFS